MSIYCVLVIVLGAGTDVINESRIISSIQPFPEEVHVSMQFFLKCVGA